MSNSTNTTIVDIIAISATPTPTNLPTPSVPEEEVNTSVAILLLLTLLYCILWTSYVLQRKQIRIIHETVVSIFLGMSVGLIIRLLSTSNSQIIGLVTFDHSYFFNLLLPPIILNSGYDMHRQNFFKNIGAILIFSLVGTFISTLVIGALLYALVCLGLHGLQIDALDCIIIGAILSSTDPVTILSIFHQLKVDSKLYAIIFGESLLNDSVAIVLFSTLGKLRGQDLGTGAIVGASLSFFAVFLGSILIGVILGLGIAMMLKYSSLQHYPSLESSLIVLQAYSSYLLSNAMQFSGIVSLLFCGIVMKHYAYDNMSMTSRQTTKNMFRIIIMVARYLSVAPLAQLINLHAKFTDPTRTEAKIPKNHQLMIWWAGLRGAIAFALSFEVEGVEKEAIQTTILVVCVISVIILGGTTPFALSYLQIKTGVTLENELETDLTENEDMDDIASQDSDILSTRLPDHWFLNFDRRYLKPIFGKKTLELNRDGSPSRHSLLLTSQSRPNA
ncbi:monovalent cation:H+ antiporter, CPA1 (nhx1) [Terramyces sp. JEL0728]|nr:monovalent cation:H+ antiporter, CPA1 (nhx1) [Terramyces sp. JEL0728]